MPPQSLQVPFWQTNPSKQKLPAQQGWPPLPQAMHVVPRQTVAKSVQPLPGQQVWPSLPQLRHMF